MDKLNLIEVELKDGWWTVYFNDSIKSKLSAKDRLFAIAEGRELAKKHKPSKLCVIEDGVETKSEQF